MPLRRTAQAGNANPFTLRLPRPAPQAYRRRVSQLESDLLLRLSTSTGNLLDDTQLIDVLALTKATAKEVRQGGKQALKRKCHRSARQRLPDSVGGRVRTH